MISKSELLAAPLQIVVAIVIYVPVTALPQPLKQSEIPVNEAELLKVQRQSIRQCHDMLLLSTVSADAVSDKVLLVIFPHEVNLIITQFEQMRKMMKGFSNIQEKAKKGKFKMPKMPNFPKYPGMPF